MQAASNKHLEQTGKGHVVKGKEATRAEAEHGSDVEEAKKRIAARKKPGLKRMDLNNPSPAHKGAMTKAKANGGGSKEQVSSWAARAASESNRK
jgi:hypothetical protein